MVLQKLLSRFKPRYSRHYDNVMIIAPSAGICRGCHRRYNKGKLVVFNRIYHHTYHKECKQ